MKSPEQRTAALLDQTVDLMFRIYLLRGDCCSTAKAYFKKDRMDYLAVEDCARLDDSLSKVYRNLQATVRKIQRSRARKRRRQT